MSKLLVNSDGVLNCHLHSSREGITGVLTQPSREVILEHNQTLRNNEHLQKDLSFGRLVCNMPVLDLMHWTKLYPLLGDYSNPKARRKEWLRFLASSEGTPYLVRTKKQGRV